MKVLFAVSNEGISEAIVKRYQKEYKEIISYKNVYYFNAILKEIQKDKTYDRIVISEELEAFAHTQYDQIDKFIFEKLDSISDEASNLKGDDTPIILICSDRRAKSEEMLVKLFGIGIYNAIIGNDRSVEEVCNLIHKPRLKKEAKLYYKIDSEDVKYQSENENDVSEQEIQNILAHYKRLGKNEEKYVTSFDNIVAQYNDAQLRIISKFLPLNVRAVLEEKSPKYQQIMSFNNSVTNSIRKTSPKQENLGPSEKLLRPQNKNVVMTEPIVIPSAVNTNNVKKLARNPQPINNINAEQTSRKNEDYLEETEVKRRGRPRKVSNIEEIETGDQEKIRRRGRPRKNIQQEDFEDIDDVLLSNLAPQEEKNQKFDDEYDSILPGFENEHNQMSDLENEQDSMLPGFEDEQDAILPGFENKQEPMGQEFEDEQDSMLPGFDYEQDTTLPGFENKQGPMGQEFEDEQDSMLPGFDYEQDTTLPGFEDEKDSMAQKFDDGQDSMLPGFENKEKTIMPEYTNNQNTIQPNAPMPAYESNIDLSRLLTDGKKIVTFVGTSKNGTSFILNNLAEYASSIGINVAILDTTQNKNSYYIYTKNEEDLRKVAENTLQNLVQGQARGISVNRNLTVYTSLPSDREELRNVNNILETLVRNHNLILIDCDFDTPIEYFSNSQEIYLVQSLDVLTIQPLTAFLRELKAKNVLDQNKLKIILNKYVKVRGISEKTIIGGMAFYNDPAMSFMTELFDRNTVKYITIPFEEDIYTRYLESVINCDISIKGYSKTFMQVLKELNNMVYPMLSGKNAYRPPAAASYNNAFSPSMNNTLDQMKRKY